MHESKTLIEALSGRLQPAADGTGRTPCQQERGSEVVELAFLIPVIMLLLAGAVDLGLYSQAVSQVETAAVGAARYVAEHPEAADSSALKAVIERDNPGLSSANAADGYRLDVELEVGAEERSSYTHHFALSNGTYAERASMTATRPATVTVTVTRPYYTPVGAAWSTAAGGSGAVVATAAATTRIDTTDGSVW